MFPAHKYIREPQDSTEQAAYNTLVEDNRYTDKITTSIGSLRVIQFKSTGK
jgi:hypothetical protein